MVSFLLRYKNLGSLSQVIRSVIFKVHGHVGANQMLKKCWVFEPKNENVECKYFFHASILDVEHSNG